MSVKEEVLLKALKDLNEELDFFKKLCKDLKKDLERDRREIERLVGLQAP